MKVARIKGKVDKRPIEFVPTSGNVTPAHPKSQRTGGIDQHARLGEQGVGAQDIARENDALGVFFVDGKASCNEELSQPDLPV
jgi:hypothetical protein